MPTTETPFLQFWRELDAELEFIDHPQATGGQVALAWRLHQQGEDISTLALDIARGDMPTSILFTPPHQRNAGKRFAP